MLRFHMHVSVSDLDASIDFYSVLFGAAPTIVRDDYAKWMLDDPRVNFAISQRGVSPGVDHVGIQSESEAELKQIEERLAAAGVTALAQTGATCCYARSDKYWTTDPQGIPWETFHTLGSAPTFSTNAPEQASADSCCAPPSTNQCCE